MKKILAVNPERCTNCRLCELACSAVKHGAFSPLRSRIRVNPFPEQHAYVPLACFQCDDAPCARACPSGALRQEEALVRFDEKLCIGCRMCMLACPFGVISFDTESGLIAKCDTCSGDPECVRFCAPGALEFREPELAGATRSRDFARRIAQAIRR